MCFLVPNQFNQFYKIQMDKNNVDKAGKYAAILSMTEVGLGSLLHAWRIPFSGHFLSLNQGFILCRSAVSTKPHGQSTPLKVSMIAATLKSLSPIGKRLTPMLAISVQGLLFSLGQYLFGTNLIGCIFSLILLSLWAFIQPLMLYMIVFGKGILDVAQYFLTKIQVFFPIELHHLAYALLFLISLKILLAISVAILAFNSTSQFCDQYFKSLTKNFKTNQLTQHTSTASIGHRLKVVGKDLLQLWFLVSLFAMSIFFYLSDVSKVEFIWLILRPVAIGFILFYCIRFLPFEKFLFKIFGSKDSQSHKMLKRALTYFKGENHV